MGVKRDEIIKTLKAKGTILNRPDTIEIGDEVNPDRISGQGVIIHSGSKIFGEKTLILKGAQIGYEAPATLSNCQVGPEVKLNGGFFKESVFLKKATMGSCAHVREGTIFEEYAGAAHSVGVKQTILFPYVTLGSQINFCDCLMAGGTGKKNHSEVGSSYIHFNFTPQQDKATPSLIGDVPKGVMLNQSPIFLGGQGGLVGPSRLAYGITIAAGTIFRKDELRENRLIFGGAAKSGNIPYTPGSFSNIQRIFKNNLIYIANLLALKQWYENIRIQFISDEFPLTLFEGVLDKLDMAVHERIRRLDDFIQKVSEKNTKKIPEGVKQWPERKNRLSTAQITCGSEKQKNDFIRIIQRRLKLKEGDYLKTLSELTLEEKTIGIQWLQGLVDQIEADFL